MTKSADTLARQRALIADDDPFYREIAVSSLVESGFTIETVADGTAAVAQLASAKFDIAIVDLSMPGLDGFEVIRHARAEGPNQFVPIIVITGSDDHESVERAYQAGATSFVPKPVNWVLFPYHVEFVMRAARTEAELRETTHAIEFLSRLKTDLISILAREFQAPLRTAYGFSELLRYEVHGPIGSSVYKSYIEDICKSVEELNVLLLKLLHFGRALSEQLSLNEEEFQLSDLLADALHSVAATAEQKGIDVSYATAINDLVKVRGDRALLSQSLKSMLENATRFSPRGSRVAVAARLDSEGSLIFSVEDSGPALAPNQIKEILEPESRTLAAGAQSRLERNVGLGIVKILAEAHQGKLDLGSKSGAGTVARLVLPGARIVRPSSAATAGTTPLTTARPAAPRAGQLVANNHQLLGKLGNGLRMRSP